jgi:hypothetical protein
LLWMSSAPRGGIGPDFLRISLPPRGFVRPLIFESSHAEAPLVG